MQSEEDCFDLLTKRSLVHAKLIKYHISAIRYNQLSLPCELFNQRKKFMVVSTIVIELNLANKLYFDALMF